MVVNYRVTFQGERWHGLAPTVVETTEDESGVDLDGLEGHIIGYLRAATGTKARLMVQLAVTGDVGSGAIVGVSSGMRYGDCRLQRLEVSSAA